MAASATPRPTASDPCAQGVSALLAQLPCQPLGLAYSGGADSTALLHTLAAQALGRVQALHVHHGLQAAADDFVTHCQATCAALGVPLHVAQVQAHHASGQSPEDAARRARYLALATLARAQGLAHVLLAQHADDQAETVLLALSRGAGPAGLAAMPARFERHGVTFHRPLLAVPAPALREWLAAQGLPWVDDPSNCDSAYTRNRIRQHLLPVLQAQFPAFRDTFARSARNMAQALDLLEEFAIEDVATLGEPPRLAALQVLSRPRQANALRHWLRTRHAQVPSAAQLDELLDQVAACRTRGHRLRLKVGTGHVHREGPCLVWHAPPPADPGAGG